VSVATAALMTALTTADWCDTVTVIALDNVIYP
jgi:hypothetical protein